MGTKSTYRYLAILAMGLLAWIPLYPVLFALTSNNTPFAWAFLRTLPRYVYFGDSVPITSSECEADRRNLIAFLPGDMPQKTLLIAQGAGDARLWRGAARFIAADRSGHVAAAVIPINMEAFTWEHDPYVDTDFVQARLLYEMASGDLTRSEYLHSLTEAYDFMKSYRLMQAIKFWDQQPVMVGTRSIGTNLEVTNHFYATKLPCNWNLSQETRQLRLHFSFNYGAAIDAHDPYFADLEEVAEGLTSGKVHPLFYITPLNLDDVLHFGGRDLLKQVQANLAVVRQVARAKGWDLIDLSSSLPSKHFITRECACEHVDAYGRALIAHAVGKSLQQDHL